MQIKFKFLWLLALPLLITLPSCDEDLLTESPTNFLSPVNFYRNSSDAQIALNGLYAGQQRIQGYSGGDAGVALLWGMHGADEIVVPPWTPPGRRTLFLFSATPSLDVFFNVYSRHYQEINRANTVIDQVTAMTEDKINDEDRARILAEAKALRGSFYFNMVRIYNRLPLVVEERVNLENLEFTQSEPEVIYAQIIDDLTTAIADLEEFGASGQLSKGAVQALLGKVYLQMAGIPLNQTDKYALAAEQFKDVIDSDVYSLEEDFQQVFDLDNELNEEMVWVVEHDAPGQTIDGTQNSNLGSFMGPHGSLNDGGGWGTAWSMTDLELAYDRDDTRRRVTIAYGNAPNVMDSVRGPNQFKPWKWQKPAGQAWGNDTPFDYAYIRYAEVLLGYAEAHAQANGSVTTEALDAINQVRARARGDNNPETAVVDIQPGLSIAEFIDVIDNERYLELAFEGHRKGDLIRWGRLVDRMNNLTPQTAVWPGLPEAEPHEIFWPIPQGVLDVNPQMEQNPGW
ncbi:RagB/SusD family nutrient uptake outer membrane protein [Neolewinella agarilytica]|uniref:Starch-binding associating with outer membrane n=1 Tax=Neolewinella agarilytica TaxID=478744 RepID=A0A1H9D159_9BACT|nr:RagB/SusD family nutrient uptake outer membrane protein [Neolewinella agarilytica]SEQ06543.1 Starch-binding associating with outer membrane [Neolewinella agarilytica]